MKPILYLSLWLVTGLPMYAQKNATDYPVPEFINEVYYLVKDSMKLVRLEKDYSKMETKVKFGGADQEYALEGNKSPTRLPGEKGFSFVYYTGAASGASSDHRTDSMLRANGIDPQTMGNATMDNDPSKAAALYSMNTEKNKRKLILQAYGSGFGVSKAKKETNRYTFSVRKLKDGYYVLVIDKPLPKGEYAFVITSMGSMDNSSLLFAFGVD
jgi:hypothetical protein